MERKIFSNPEFFKVMYRYLFPSFVFCIYLYITQPGYSISDSFDIYQTQRRHICFIHLIIVYYSFDIY